VETFVSAITSFVKNTDWQDLRIGIPERLD